MFNSRYDTFLNVVCLYTCTFPFKWSLLQYFLYVKSTSMFSPFRTSLHESRRGQIQYNTLFRSRGLDTVAAHRLTPSSPVGLAIKQKRYLTRNLEMFQPKRTQVRFCYYCASCNYRRKCHCEPTTRAVA